MSGGITTINGGTVPSNFTSGPVQPLFTDGFNIGTTVASIFSSGVFSVGGSTTYPSTAALTANGLATTITGASLIAFQGTNDTVTPAGNLPYTALLGNGSVLNEGSGPSTVYAGSGASTVTAGSGSTTVVGGNGSLTFSGGSSSNDSVTAGSGMNTLTGGSGGSNTLIGGAGGTTINLSGSSTGDQVVGGTGVTSVDASSATGKLEIDTNPSGKGILLATLGSGADTVVGGGGISVIQAGSGADVFAFVKGYAGGAEIISGFNATDNIVFQGYGYNLAATPSNAPPEQVLAPTSGSGGGDLITLTDGTQIFLVGIDHKIF